MAPEPKGRLGNAGGLLPPLAARPQHPPPLATAAQESATGSVRATEYRKTTVTLALGDMEYLDELALRIRRRHGTHIDRGAILRALIAAVRASGLDLAAAPHEGAIRAAVAERLRV